MSDSSSEEIDAAVERVASGSDDEIEVADFKSYRTIFLSELLNAIEFKFEITEEILANLTNEDYEIPLPDAWMLYTFVPNKFSLETLQRYIKALALCMEDQQKTKAPDSADSILYLIQLCEDWFALSEKLKTMNFSSTNYPFREACAFLDLCILKPLSKIRFGLHEQFPQLNSLTDKYFDVVVNTPVFSLFETYINDVFQVMNTNIDYYAIKKEAILFCDKALKDVLLSGPHRIWVIHCFSNLLIRYEDPAECVSSKYAFVNFLTHESMMDVYYTRLVYGRPSATIRALLGLMKALFSAVLDVSIFKSELIRYIGLQIFKRDRALSIKAAEAYIKYLTRSYSTERVLEEIIIFYATNKANSVRLHRYLIQIAKVFPYLVTNDAIKQLLEVAVDGENTPVCIVNLIANVFACLYDAAMYLNQGEYRVKLGYLLEILPGYLNCTQSAATRALLINPLRTVCYETIKQVMDENRFEELTLALQNYLLKEFTDCREVECSYMDNLGQCLLRIISFTKHIEIFNELFNKLFSSFCSKLNTIESYMRENQEIPVDDIYKFRTILQKMFVVFKCDKEEFNILDTNVLHLAFLKIFHGLKRLLVDTDIMITLAGRSNTFIDRYAIGVMCAVLTRYRFYVPNYFELDSNLLLSIPSIVAYLVGCLENKPVLPKCAVIRVRTIFESATLLLKNFDITLDDFTYDKLVDTLVLLVFETKIYNVEDGDEDNEKQPERINRNLSYMLEAFSSLHYSDIKLPNYATTRLLLYYPLKHKFQTELLNLMKAIYYYDYEYFQFIMSRTLLEFYVARSSGIKEAFKQYISSIEQCNRLSDKNPPPPMVSAVANGIIDLIILNFSEIPKSNNRLSILLHLCPFYKNIPTKYQKPQLISLTYYLVKLLNLELTDEEHKTIPQFLKHLRYLPWNTMAFNSPTDNEMLENAIPESLEVVLQYMKDNQDKVKQVVFMALK